MQNEVYLDSLYAMKTKISSSAKFLFEYINFRN